MLLLVVVAVVGCLGACSTSLRYFLLLHLILVFPSLHAALAYTIGYGGKTHLEVGRTGVTAIMSGLHAGPSQFVSAMWSCL